MRLGQLARRLSLRQAQIVEFLANNNIQIDTNSNTRLEDSHVSMIVEHYAPESLMTIASEPDEGEEVASEIIQLETAVPESVEGAEPPMTSEEKTILEAEVIRVQKIELSGLKVLGKIELPEPRKKEAATEPKPDDVEEGDSIERPAIERPSRQRSNNRKPHQNRERSQQRSWKNPLELQREREAREAEAKKQRDLEREKEKRKKHYQEKMKSAAQPKKPKARTSSEAPKKNVDTRPAPKTWFGKFLRWWTT